MSSTEGNVPPDLKPTDAELLDQQYQIRVQNIAAAIKEKQCILFLGSAIHAPSSNANYSYAADRSPPFGDGLAKLLSSKSLYSDKDPWNLPRVARFYEYQLGFRNSLIKEIRNIIQNEIRPPAEDGTDLPPLPRQPSPVLCGLVRLNFPIIITTNYDQLYERAISKVAVEDGSSASYLKSVYSPRETVRTSDCEREPSATRPYLLKIHGDVDDVDSIVVTDEDYLQFVLRMRDKHPYNPVGKNVHRFLSDWPTLFIGYRLSDYNLRLLIKTLRWKMKRSEIPPSYSIDLQPDVLIRDTMEKDQVVGFIEKNLWDFVPDLYRAVKGREMPK
jgi:hypothetical protein